MVTLSFPSCSIGSHILWRKFNFQGRLYLDQRQSDLWRAIGFLSLLVSDGSWPFDQAPLTSDRHLFPTPIPFCLSQEMRELIAAFWPIIHTTMLDRRWKDLWLFTSNSWWVYAFIIITNYMVSLPLSYLWFVEGWHAKKKIDSITYS